MFKIHVRTVHHQVAQHHASTIRPAVAVTIHAAASISSSFFLFSAAAVVYAVAGTLRVLQLRTGHGEIFKNFLPNIQKSCCCVDFHEL